MKITAIDVIVAKALKSGQIPVFCRIHTDEGIYGDGEAGVSIMHGTLGSAPLIKVFAEMIIGKDPLNSDAIYDQLFATFNAQGNGGIIMSAISAIDTALYDIKGKYLGVPVYVLLGGKYRDKIRAYASQLQGGWRHPNFHNANGDIGFFRESYERAKADGYDAVKINFIAKGPDGQRNPMTLLRNYIPKEQMKAFIERLEAARDVFGPDTDIMIENHNLTGAKTAIEFGLACEPYDIFFLEEAALPFMTGEYKKMWEKLNIPIATGEHSYTRWGFLPLLEGGYIQVAQPDIGNCGGITECRKIADLAQTYGASIQCHTCNSPLSTAAALQLEAAIPNFIIHEYVSPATFPDNIALCKYDYQPVNGYYTVPDRPGLGNELSEQCIAEAEIMTVK